MSERRTAIRSSFLIGISAGCFGFAVWALSPALLGVAEPWDTDAPIYGAALSTCGALAGWVGGRWGSVAAGFAGVWLGQVAALAVLPNLDRGWLLLGVVSTAVGSLYFLVVAGAVVGVRRLLRVRTTDAGSSAER